MSKSRRCMHQAPEKPSFARVVFRLVIEISRYMVRCSVAILCATLAVGCSPNTDNRSSETKLGATVPGTVTTLRTLHRGLPGEPRTLDPQLADDTYSFQVVGDLFEGLTAVDRHGQVVPGVASSWTINTAGTVYTFQLRPDAKWSDGKRTVAAEFVQGFRRAVDPKT